MFQIPKEKILERWDNLSDILKDTVFADETYDVIGSVSEKYSLTENQTNILTANILNVLRGFLNYDDFWKSLKSDLGVTDEISSRLFMEIKEKIFNPIDKEIGLAYSPLKETPSPTTMEIIKEPSVPSSPETKLPAENLPVTAVPVSQPAQFSPTINIPIPVPLPPQSKIIESQPLVETTPIPSLPSWVAGPIIEAPIEPINIIPTAPINLPSPIITAQKTEIVSLPPKPLGNTEQKTTVPAPAPFIFHQEENPVVSVIASGKGINYQPLKPIFYGEGGVSEENKPSTFVRLEFGPTATNSPVRQTPAQSEIIGNNSPTSANEPSKFIIKKSTDTEKTAVPEENILNLKDLPL